MTVERNEKKRNYFATPVHRIVIRSHPFTARLTSVISCHVISFDKRCFKIRLPLRLALGSSPRELTNVLMIISVFMILYSVIC